MDEASELKEQQPIVFTLDGQVIVKSPATAQIEGTVYTPSDFTTPEFLEELRRSAPSSLDVPSTDPEGVWCSDVLYYLRDSDLLPKDVILALPSLARQYTELVEFITGEGSSTIKGFLSPASILAHGAIMSRELASRISQNMNLEFSALARVDTQVLQRGDHVSIAADDHGDAQISVVRSGPSAA